MRKFAMTTIAAATLLVGGLTGCGVDNQAGDMGGGTFRGAGTGTGHQPTTEQRGMTGARYTGEGPITDMFTTDDRTGRYGGAGFGATEQRRGGAIDGGQLGVQDRYLGTPGGLNMRPADRTAPGAGTAGGTGFFGQDRQGTGIFGQDRQGTTGQEQGRTGQVGQNRQGTGMNHAQSGTRSIDQGRQGMTGQATHRAAEPDQRGNRGMTGATGMTGQRAGMVNDQGVLEGNQTGHPRLTAGPHPGEALAQKQGNRGQQGTITGQGRTGQQGTLTGQRNMTGAQTGAAGQDARTQEIERTVESMENVDNCNVVAHGDSIIVGVDAQGQNSGQLENQIRQQVQRIAEGQDVYVVTDKEQVEDIRTMNERIQNDGGAMGEVGATLNEMINDLARATQRPFERSR